MQPTGHSAPEAAPDRWKYPRRVFLFIGVAVVLHLNYWLWTSDRLVLGLPINLFYHVVLTLVLAIAMWALVRWHWPPFLDDESPE